MTSPALYRRIVRRETHSSRAGIAVTVAVILALVLAWIGTESVLAGLGRPPLLVTPADAATAVLGAASAPVGLVTAIAAAVAVVGVVLVVVALAPGRRGRRGALRSRTATVVDDGVIARSLARTASYAGDVDPDQVHVTVARRRAVIDVTRTSGRSTDVGSIRAAVDAELAEYDYTPALRARVRVSEKGTVGA
ncbi:hypothetical protein [Herbiconiux liangxiaofengii]|uniref:hypothetical protein n=1 Tax=Herbiconiux liangxiaofengii TaxID=3342795 RepID=UPI0035B81AA4